MDENAQQKIQSVIDAWTAAANSSTKTMAAQKAAQAALVKQLITLEGLTEDQARQAAKEINRADEAAKKEEERNKKVADSVVKSLDAVRNLAGGAISAGQAAYNASDVFQAVTPTLDLLGNAAKAVADVLSTAASGIPYLGSIASAAAKGAAVYVDISTQLAKAQFDNASKYIKTYSDLSKAGVTFGADLKAMQESAASAGMSLESYSNFVTKNVENLSMLGGTIQSSSERIMKMGKTIADGNPKLLAMYGSYEDLDGAIASFAAKSAKYGVDAFKNQDALRIGATDYLNRLKQLTELTGITADRAQKEEDARLKFADYQAEMADLQNQDTVAANRVKESLSYIGVALGKEFNDLGSEYFARRGQIISQEGLLVNQIGGTASEVTKQIVDLAKNWKGTEEGFNAERARILKDSNAQILDENKVRAETGSLMRGTNDEAVKMYNSMSVSIREGTSLREGAQKAVAELKDRLDKPPTKEAVDFVGAINELQKFKITMDKKTAEQFDSLAISAKNLLSVQEKLTELFGPNEASFNTAIGKLVKVLEALAGKETQPDVGKNLFKEDENSGAFTKGFNQLNAWMAGKQYSGGVINAPGGKMQVPEKGTMLPGSAADTGFKVKVKAGQSKFEYDSRLQDTVNKLVDSNFPISYISGINDQFHKDNKKTSKHTEGKALDFILSQMGFANPKEGDVMAARMSSLLGGARVQFEDKNRDSVDASHFHMELMKKGGITNGPSIAGEAGPEAVVPLPDGRTIPVKMDNSEVISKLEEMIDVLKDQRDTSEKILHASM